MCLSQELERGMEAMGKNHHQEVRLLRQKNKALAHENEDLRNTTQRLHSQFKVCTNNVCECFE